MKGIIILEVTGVVAILSNGFASFFIALMAVSRPLAVAAIFSAYLKMALPSLVSLSPPLSRVSSLVPAWASSWAT